jgi:beta-1,2-mannobiose phosphorylase / 1,2-beta-oligomannan phosphorylase
MEPQPGNPHEVEGVLNPAAARGQDGHLYLFPRLVARGNYSRIGIARVIFNQTGDPCGVERLGIALEPEADYERRSDGGGGCKDASLFPTSIANHAGKMQMALLHRPLFPGTRPEETARRYGPREVDLDHESIWISYCPMPTDGAEAQQLGLFNSHHRLAAPVAPWARLKVGAGTPPILTRHGWLVIYHGVSERADEGDGTRHLCYSAGLMVLSREHPRHILYRSAESVLTPTLPIERRGTVANVVFPTGIDRRDDLGSPDRFDVYYGMADNRIGVARLDLPHSLPSGGVGAVPEGKV